MLKHRKMPAALATVLASGAIAVPAASAHVQRGDPAPVPASTGPVSEVVSGNGYGLPASPTPSAAKATPTSGGFDWGDAGVGAAATLSLLVLGASATTITRRARLRHTAG